MLNIRTNIMNLQFGCDKCEKLHIGKTQNKDICPELTFDSWKEELIEGVDGSKHVEEIYSGKSIMKEIEDKKYFLENHLSSCTLKVETVTDFDRIARWPHSYQAVPVHRASMEPQRRQHELLVLVHRRRRSQGDPCTGPL